MNSIPDSPWRLFIRRLKKQADAFFRSLSITEKTLFSSFIALLAAGALIVLININEKNLVTMPKRGGTLIEGVIGSPRFINPLLAISDADRDLTLLVYSGLLRATPGGELVPDLAERWSVSENGLEYTFLLKDNVVFHDGEPVTADDVVFTINRAQDPNLKSPKRASFEGINIEKVSDREIKMTLKQAYAPFLENATISILPRHFWKDIEPEQFPFSPTNVQPVGSGPYVISKVKRSSSGVPLSYELSPFKKYAGGAPFIERLIFRFYQSEEKLLEAYDRKEIEAVNSISPNKASSLSKETARLIRTPLPRVFGIFFNQNQAPLFANKEVREALDISLNKKRVIEEVLKGYGTTLDGPIPPNILEGEILGTTTESFGGNPEKAAVLLERGGWKRNEKEGILEKKVKSATQKLSFSLATSNAAELKLVAELLKAEWEKLGARVEVKIFEPGDLNQNIIRPRKYDALLFGEIVGRDLDLFAFWHSSQRNDPGLNIALYTNIKADKLLEEARAIQDKEERLQKYRAFEAEIERDTPAIFLYAPDFIYAIPAKVKGVKIERITVPGDRFLGIERWFIETEKVWGIFARP